MNFHPHNHYLHIERQALPTQNDDSPIWTPPNEPLHEQYVVVVLVSPESILMDKGTKLVVDSRMIESFTLDGKKVEFIKEQYVVGRLTS